MHIHHCILPIGNPTTILDHVGNQFRIIPREILAFMRVYQIGFTAQTFRAFFESPSAHLVEKEVGILALEINRKDLLAEFIGVVNGEFISGGVPPRTGLVCRVGDDAV
jgi:hypothetical protein